MPPKTIAVFLPDEAQAREIASSAIDLARHHDAHVVGVCVVPGLNFPTGVAVQIPQTVLDHARAEQLRVAERIEALFREALRREDVRGEWRVVDAHGGDLAETLLESARAADLILLRQPNSGGHDTGHLHESVIRGAGRPVLIVPPKGIGEGLHRCALIGWSPAREASRAAFDAAALLAPGAKVRLLHVGMPSERDLANGPMNALAEALDRHGFDVSVSHRSAKSRPITDVIEQEAFEHGADFIATGAFGHSRMYDFVVGAVSRDIIRRTVRPVLLSK